MTLCLQGVREPLSLSPSENDRWVPNFYSSSRKEGRRALAIRRGMSLSKVFPEGLELLSSLPPFREMLGTMRREACQLKISQK